MHRYPHASILIFSIVRVVFMKIVKKVTLVTFRKKKVPNSNQLICLSRNHLFTDSETIRTPHFTRHENKPALLVFTSGEKFPTTTPTIVLYKPKAYRSSLKQPMTFLSCK